METRLSTDDFTRELASRHRVLLLGGMAIIAHGLSRPTKDSDIWLEPFATVEEWVTKCLEVVSAFPGSYIWSLAERRRLDAFEEVVADISDYGVIRISGLDLPLDIFRKPNELELDEFEAVWAAAKPLNSGLRLPHEMDLYRTKANTGREHDWKDQLFLESLVKARFKERLPVCDLAEATSMLDRFLDPEALQHARTNPHPEVRALALKYLREFEAEGDPYSRDILAAGGWEA
ncbi:MAG: hypothetical protein Q8M07_25705 [Prosthecobacter sp.]|nr:hypothetical protein [Prosthecobacter sp.]